VYARSLRFGEPAALVIETPWTAAKVTDETAGGIVGNIATSFVQHRSGVTQPHACCVGAFGTKRSKARTSGVARVFDAF
jgi:hypothetical protein